MLPSECCAAPSLVTSPASDSRAASSPARLAPAIHRLRAKPPSSTTCHGVTCIRQLAASMARSHLSRLERRARGRPRSRPPVAPQWPWVCQPRIPMQSHGRTGQRPRSPRRPRPGSPPSTGLPGAAPRRSPRRRRARPGAPRRTCCPRRARGSTTPRRRGSQLLVVDTAEPMVRVPPAGRERCASAGAAGPCAAQRDRRPGRGAARSSRVRARTGGSGSSRRETAVQPAPRSAPAVPFGGTDSSVSAETRSTRRWQARSVERRNPRKSAAYRPHQGVHTRERDRLWWFASFHQAERERTSDDALGCRSRVCASSTPRRSWPGPWLPDPRRLRRRRDQDRAPARRRQHARARPEQGRRPAVVDGDRPQQAHRRPGPASRRRAPRSCGAWSPPPTSWSRTSGPAPWSAGASAPTCCIELNPGLVVARITGFGQTGPVRRPRRLRHPRRGDERLRGSSPARPTGRPRCRPSASPTASAASPRPRRSLMALRHRDATGAGPGRRPEHPRADHDRGRAGPDDLRAAPARRAAPRQPVDQQRAAQHLPRPPTATGSPSPPAPSAIAERVLRAGRPPRGDRRAVVRHRRTAAPQHADLLDAYVGDWIAARTRDEVLEPRSTEAGAAVARSTTPRDLTEDPHVRETADAHRGRRTTTWGRCSSTT